jgi:CPA2 family monovalent cation:H+ antiporter-2
MSSSGILVHMSSILAVGAPPLVQEFAITVAAAAVFGYLAQRVGLVSIVGFLVAGVAIGPNALGWIDDLELVEQMAEIGVIFLMFYIGLELSGDMLRKMGSLLFGGGALQVGLVIMLVTGVAVLLGVDIKPAIYTGCLIALSSTAVVLKLLSTNGETNTPTGSVAVAFLIFQDIAVVLLVLLVPMLGDDGGDVGEIVWATARALIVILLLIIVAKWVIPLILDRVAEHTDGEEFLLAVVALAGGVAYAVTLFGLTASLGAFVAGLVVAAGPHRDRATKNIMPFQALFAAVFFASIGMLLDPNTVLDLWPVILFFCALVVVIKLVSTGIAAKVFGQPSPVAVASSFVLAQVGEFAFILEKIGRDAGLTPADRGDDGSQVFIAVTVVLIALTPLLYSTGRRLQAAMVGPVESENAREVEDQDQQRASSDEH